MEYHERYLADILESLLAISKRPLLAIAKEIPDGGFQITINGIIPEVLFGGQPAEQVISLATGYTDVSIERCSDEKLTYIIID